ncbi:tetratricopeptide repeat protein [Streptomyces sp. NPDC058642]|uniref:tetratricopeptide repeat protein n=1 Tax=Streptomyces sp. NPDC058642 TaxID=3346572 RepID=UPI003663CC11
MWQGRWRWGPAGLLLAPVAAGVVGVIVWSVAHFGLNKADQTSSVVGGVVGVIGLLISLLALRAPASSNGPGPDSTGPNRQWVNTAASHPSYRPPHPRVQVRGRDEELATLHQLSEAHKARLAVICGTGGMGKTTLAAQTARQAEASGRAVFWVRWQDDPSRLADDLTRIAQALGLSETRLHDAHTGHAVLVDVVWDHLASTRGWVIIVDNVDTPRHIGPGSDPLAVYRGWLRPDGAGLLLVTSRDSSSATWGPCAHLMHLEPLSPAAAGAVLLASAPGAGTAAEAEALGIRLGGLPLALDAASLYLVSATSRYTTFAAYQHALDSEFSDLIAAEHPQASDPEVARTVVRHTFDVSLDQLHADGYDLARPLLRVLALLEDAPIPRSLISPALLGGATGRSATAAELDAALAGLHQYGLLTAPTPTGVSSDGMRPIGQVVLHPLVRDVMALASLGTDRAAWHTAIDLHLTQAVNKTAEAGRLGWPTARLLVPHIPPLLDRATDRGFTTARDTINTLAETVNEAGATADARLLHQYVLAASERILGPDHPAAFASRNKLAEALRRLGRHHEAIDLHQQNLTQRERALGSDHPETLKSRNNLALTLFGLGHYQEAANLHQQNLNHRERTLGPDHPATLSSRNNLAIAVRSLGRHQEAIDLHQQNLTHRERIFGLDHPVTLNTRNNLAEALRYHGHHQEAIDLHQQTLTDRERALGPHHPETLSSRSGLAEALRFHGHHQEAVDLHRQTLTDREHVLGPHHPLTLSTRNNLAEALRTLGHHQEAVDLHQQTLTDREHVLGPHHPETLNSRNNLAAAQAAAGRTARRRAPWARRAQS